MSAAFYILVFGTFFYILTCIAILDIALRDFGETYRKILWVFVAMVPFFGVLVYFFYGRRKGVRRGSLQSGPEADDPPLENVQGAAEASTSNSRS